MLMIRIGLKLPDLERGIRGRRGIVHVQVFASRILDNLCTLYLVPSTFYLLGIKILESEPRGSTRIEMTLRLYIKSSRLKSKR